MHADALACRKYKAFEKRTVLVALAGAMCCCSLLGSSKGCMGSVPTASKERAKGCRAGNGGRI